MLRQLGERNQGHAVWIRVNPGFGHGHSQKTNTGGKIVNMVFGSMMSLKHYL